MVIDTSAIVGVLLGEPEAEAFIEAITADSRRLMSSFSVFEAAVVVESRKGAAGGRELDLLLHEAEVTVVPFSGEHIELARDAYRRFGKGRDPAGLNLGDCAAYALALHSGEPLLYKGDDFARTDVRSALARDGMIGSDSGQGSGPA